MVMKILLHTPSTSCFFLSFSVQMYNHASSWEFLKVKKSEFKWTQKYCGSMPKHSLRQQFPIFLSPQAFRVSDFKLLPNDKKQKQSEDKFCSSHYLKYWFTSFCTTFSFWSSISARGPLHLVRLMPPYVQLPPYPPPFSLHWIISSHTGHHLPSSISSLIFFPAKVNGNHSPGC